MGSDESHFNVSVGSVGQSHRTVSTNHNLFEEKGEPKRVKPSAQVLTLQIIGALKLPPNQKAKETGKKRLKGHGPEHTQYTRLHLFNNDT